MQAPLCARLALLLVFLLKNAVDVNNGILKLRSGGNYKLEVATVGDGNLLGGNVGVSVDGLVGCALKAPAPYCVGVKGIKVVVTSAVAVGVVEGLPLGFVVGISLLINRLLCLLLLV